MVHKSNQLNQMNALVLTDYKQLSLQTRPVPAPLPNEVLIRVMAVGICGSDVHGFDGSTGRRVPPLVMGHEAAGVIAEIGAEVRGWAIGDRVTFDSTVYALDDWYSRRGQYNLSDGREVVGVACAEFRRDGAFAEFVTVPQHILYHVPASVSFTQAAMVEPVAVALHALSPIHVGDSAVVIGAGMIGLFVIQALTLAGCQTIIAVDLADDRLTLAQSLGATHTLNACDADVPAQVRALTYGRGADVGFEVVGTSATLNTAIESVRKGATITLVGNISPKVEVPLQQIVTRQLRLQGSCAINGEYEAALALIASGRINVDAILTAEVPLADGPAWFDRLYNREPGLMKVVLKP
jgi:L-iditol 2-dehydrogenase